MTKPTPDNLPQLVTNRYVNTLLVEGKNDVFRIHATASAPFKSEEIICGYYFSVIVTHIATNQQLAGVGPSPQFALRMALEKFGVTFKQ